MFTYDKENSSFSTNAMRTVSLTDQVDESMTPTTTIFDKLNITVQAGLYGLANNAIQIGKWTGIADEDTTLYDVGQELDNNGGQLGSAYRANQWAYDLTGDIAASFVPGGAAMWAIKAAKLGKLGKTSMTLMGGFEGAALKSADEMAQAYKNVGSAANVSAMRASVWKNSVAQNAVEGAIISTAVEASLNLGDILNNEGLSATEKLLKFGYSVGLGAGIQGVIGGALTGRSILAGTKEVKAAVFNADELPFTYRSLSSTIGNRPTQIPSGNKLALVIGEYDRIAGRQALNPAQQTAQKLNLVEAEKDMNLVLNELFPKKASGASNLADEISPMRELVRERLKTTEGRQEVALMMSGLEKFQAVQTSAWADNSAMNALLKSMNAKTVTREELIAAGGGETDKFLSVNLKQAGTNKIESRVLIADDANMSLTEQKEMMADYALRRKASVTSNVPKAADDFDAIKIDMGLPASTSDFEVMKKAYALRRETGAKEFGAKYKGLNTYFSQMSDDVLDAVYRPKAVAYVDSVTGAITAAPIKHLGDLRGLAYSEANGVVAWTDAAGLQVAVSSADLPVAGITTDLVKYQALRLLGGSKSRAETLLKVQGGINNFGAYTAKDFFALERAVAGRTPRKGKNGETDYYDVAGAKVGAEEAKKAIAEFKAKEFQRLLEAEEGVSAADVANTLGVTEKFVLYRGKIGSVSDASGRVDTVVESDFLADSSLLAGRKSYTMEYGQDGLLDAHNADIYSQLESYRAIQQGRLRDTAKQVLGEDLEDVFGTSLGIEDVSGFGAQRLLSNASQLGGYQGFIAKATFVGDWILRKSDEYFAHKIAPAMKDYTENLLSSPTAKAEYAALTEWYSQQAEKFIRISDGLYVAESEAVNVLKGIKAGLPEGDVLKNLIPNRAYMRIDDPDTRAYVANLQRLNQTHVLNKRANIEAAYGNDVNIVADSLYLPPRDYKHMTFIVEGAPNPLSTMGSKVYRIVANTKEELEKQVQDAMTYANSNGLQWTQQTSAQINEYKTAKMQWEWAGDVVKTSTANSALTRSGQVSSLSTDGDAAALVMKDLEWFKRQVTSVHRAGVELHFAEDISKLNTLISQDRARNVTNLNPIEGIKVRFGTGVAVRDKPSDFEQVLSTLLGADNAGASTWRAFNNTLEDWSAKTLTATSGVWHKIRWKRNQANVAMWQEEGAAVEKALKEKGIGLPMGNYVKNRLERETTIHPEDIRKYASMMNLVQSTLLLRLDAADSAVNVLGAIVKAGGEMSYLKTLAKAATPEQQANFAREWDALFSAGTAKGVAGNTSMFSTAKAMAAGYARYFTPEGKADLDRWLQMGLAVADNKVIRDAFEDIRLDTSLVKTSAQLNTHMEKVAKAGTKMIDFLGAPSRHSGMMSQYAALSMAERLGKSLGMKDADLANFMFSFNRRVNAITNPVQKPRLFQGVAGIAVSLYQSYMFHMMRNVFRYADSGSKAPLATIAALNGTFFGAQSVPGFETLNSFIGERSDGRTDIYGAVSAAFGSELNERDVTDFMLYGAGSWLFQGALHTRGTLTPRTPTLIPTNPQDLPIANAAMKLIGSVTESVQKVAYGAPVGQTLAEGIVNLGLNRPLTGIMDIARGKAVDANYSTVMFHDDIYDIGTMAVRVAGLKPLNQVITSSYQQRVLAYKALDAKRKTALGEEIRTMYSANPENLSNPEIVQKWNRKYLSAGGTAGNFEGFLSDQLLKAQNDLAQRLEKTVGKNATAIQQYRAMMEN